MCSDKHCHKSLQIICREKSKDVRIKGSFLPFVSMQDFLFFKVVITHISLCCILLHLCRDVRITLSVVLFGVINRTQRHRVLVWRFCFTVCFPPVILRILPWLSSAAFGCWPSSIALSKHTGVRNCCSAFSIFPYPFPAAAPRYSKMGIIIFGTNMYCRSNQPAGFSYGIKYNINNLCSDKHCHQSL